MERDWQTVERHAERAASVDPGVGAPESALVALSLDHAYQAFESLLVRVERALGLPPRQGTDWHRAVLADAKLDLPDLRPALVDDEAERAWDELRRFRHFLRRAYPLELDAERLRAIRGHLEAAVQRTGPAVLALLRALET